ncbi:hypothetical protein, partial [Burkholderia gladioli]|uniref:hypothetical protein n=1 Tax=Burkholderia gladioli TaxID=28095 RepID=UPI001FC8340D
MTRDERGEGLLECGDIERAVDTHGKRDVISRVARLQLLEEPEPLLSERKPQGRIASDRHQRSRGPGGTCAVDASREARQRGVLEQRTQRQ